MTFDKRTVSEKRRAANQAAAQKSTGPKTSEGKQRAAFHSFQHGAFASEDHILRQALDRSGYDAAEFDARRQELLDDWQPGGAQQKLLIDDLAWLYWLRDQSRLALIDGQARRLPRLQLERDQRRFNACHRAPAVNYDDYSAAGYAHLEASEEKITGMAELLRDLEACLTGPDWSHDDGQNATPAHLLDYLYGETRTTARGRRLAELWEGCAKAEAAADDPRVAEIRALIAEERAALAEEEQLFRRRQEIEIEQPENTGWPGLHPLDEAWQRAALGIERLDRQINAKIRLLIRLQARAAQTNRANTRMDLKEDGGESFAHATAFHGGERMEEGSDRSLLVPAPGDDAKIRGTKPSDPLESTNEPTRIASYSSQDDPAAPRGPRRAAGSTA